MLTVKIVISLMMFQHSVHNFSEAKQNSDNVSNTPPLAIVRTIVKNKNVSSDPQVAREPTTTEDYFEKNQIYKLSDTRKMNIAEDKRHEFESKISENQNTTQSTTEGNILNTTMATSTTRVSIWSVIHKNQYHGSRSVIAINPAKRCAPGEVYASGGCRTNSE